MRFANFRNSRSGGFRSVVTVTCVTLTFRVTSSYSSTLVMNTIMSGSSQETDVEHRIVWVPALNAAIETLIVARSSGAAADPLPALRNPMIISALPFTMVMVAMCLCLAKAMVRDGMRAQSGAAQASLAE